MRRYTQIYDGNWFMPARKGSTACCDCGLVHDEEYRLVKAGRGKAILMKMVRNKKATAARRRSMGIKIKSRA